MVKNPICVLIMIFTLYFCASAQPVFNYGPELGVSFSQFPVKEPRTTPYYQSMDRSLPLPGPLVGFNSQLTLKKHFQVCLGLQYQMTGQRNHYQSTSKSFDQNANFTGGSDMDEYWERQTFHKLCLPLTVGYAFRIGKVKTSIYLGTRPNFIFAGKYYFKFISDHEDNSMDLTFINQFNPLNPQFRGIPLKPFNNQVVAGVSATISNHLKINLSLNAAQNLHYSQSKSFGWEPNFTFFSNTDLVISFTWLMNPVKK